MLKPLASERWNFTTAAHLLNRAGFGGPPAEIEKLVALGPEKGVARFVDYEAIPERIRSVTTGRIKKASQRMFSDKIGGLGVLGGGGRSRELADLLCDQTQALWNH